MHQVVIVDDERLSLEELKDQLTAWPDIQLTGAFVNPSEALAFMTAEPPDIAFLDIQMPGTDGLTLARQLLEVSPETQVIFVTAFEQYALQAYDMLASAYLLKPFKSDKLKRVMERALKIPPVSRQPVKKETECPRVYLLGDPRITFMGQQVRWSAAKVEELFVYLLVRRGRMISKYHLYADVFPELSEDQARVYLHTCVYRLRKTLKSAGLSEMFRLEHAEQGYTFYADALQLDMDMFKQAAVDGLMTRSPDTLARAEALYGGDLFARLDALWIEEERELFRLMHENVCRALIKSFWESHDFQRALGMLDQLLLRDHTNDTFIELRLGTLERMSPMHR